MLVSNKLQMNARTIQQIKAENRRLLDKEEERKQVIRTLMLLAVVALIGYAISKLTGNHTSAEFDPSVL